MLHERRNRSNLYEKSSQIEPSISVEILRLIKAGTMTVMTVRH